MSKRSENRWLFLAARLIAGGLFLALGLTKTPNPLLFAKEIHMYGIIPVEPQVLLNLAALLLPWIEVVCGFFLIAGLFLESSSLILGLLTVAFTGAVFYRTLAIYFSENISFWAIHFDCGCGTGDVVAWEKLLSNTAFILLCFWVYRSRSVFLTLRSLQEKMIDRKNSRLPDTP
jgi:putative oxidoreductase